MQGKQVKNEVNDKKKIYKIGIRAQDKSVWERRTPLVPEHIKQILLSEDDLQFIIESSKKRIFSDHQYQQSGAIIKNDLSECDLIIGVKQVPIQKLLSQKTYMFFSHVIKAQTHNMPALDKILQNKIRLIDYEKITNQNNNRLIAFGKYAGIAGAIDFLKGFGQYIMQMGISTPFLNANCSYKYFQLKQAYAHIKIIGQKIIEKQIPQQLRPMIFAITGRGRTAKGCLEVLQNLPITHISPDQVQKINKDKNNPDHKKTIYLVNINSQDVMVQRDDNAVFNKEDYYKNPGKYKSIFHKKYLPFITALFHCIYWDNHCPKYIKNKHLSQLAKQNKLKLLGICDVSCDLNGSIECLKQYTQPQRPFFYFDSIRQQSSFQNHYIYGKIVYLAIDFLPSELAYDASMQFSNLLKNWVAQIARSDPKASIEEQKLVPELKRAIITLNGKLTTNFEYIAKLRQKNNLLLNTMMKKEQINKTQVGQTASVLNKNVTIIPKEKIKPQILSFTEQDDQQNDKQKLKK